MRSRPAPVLTHARPARHSSHPPERRHQRGHGQGRQDGGGDCRQVSGAPPGGHHASGAAGGRRPLRGPAPPPRGCAGAGPAAAGLRRCNAYSRPGGGHPSDTAMLTRMLQTSSFFPPQVRVPSSQPEAAWGLLASVPAAPPLWAGPRPRPVCKPQTEQTRKPQGEQKARESGCRNSALGPPLGRGGLVQVAMRQTHRFLAGLKHAVMCLQAGAEQQPAAPELA